ncbi:MAG TPA: NAD-dependent epimerase/dehydratase family protein [Bryobacteraceae bacterium]|jgi:nucleoside-diphosphate-sugar epimerase|nr:NAD-dependent epimerase/dehydratase family protein [Bryobacteraceae bacterium]
MRVLVMGGSGHIGTYLSPQLAEAGHDVICVSRGMRVPYQPHDAWGSITRVTLDRPAEEARGELGRLIADLGAEVVIDLTCYAPSSAKQLVEALRGRVGHFLHCGTIWVHGHCVHAPTTEDAPRAPFGDYGIRKAAIEHYLLEQAREGFPATVLHPGHLVGPGWTPVNPAGNFNPDVFADLAAGREVTLPNLGMETLHHVHAADVASAFVRAVEHRAAAIGESFHVVSSAALTLRGYAERMSAWFGREERLRFLPWEEWRAQASEKDARITWDHLAHSPHCSIEKARQLLGYAPRYGSLEAVQESVAWMARQGLIAGLT